MAVNESSSWDPRKNEERAQADGEIDVNQDGAPRGFSRGQGVPPVFGGVGGGGSVRHRLESVFIFLL